MTITCPQCGFCGTEDCFERDDPAIYGVPKSMLPVSCLSCGIEFDPDWDSDDRDEDDEIWSEFPPFNLSPEPNP